MGLDLISKDNWDKAAFSDVVSINPRESLKKGTKAKKISMADIKEYTKNIESYSVEEYKSGPKFRRNDTLFARITPSLENGKISKVNILDEAEVGFGSTELIVMRAKPNITDVDYIYYLSWWDKVRNTAIKSMTGTSGRQRVQNTVFDTLEINLPPLNEQKEIARVLSSFDDKIENNNAIIANLEEQAQAIFKSWFVDFEPFQNGAFVNSEVGKIPENWEVTTLKELSQEIVTGKTPRTKNSENYGDMMPFITIPDMHDNVYIVESERYLSEQGVRTQKNKTLPKNSIIMSCIATVGLVSLISEDSQTNQQINAVITKGNISPYYIYSFLNTQKDYLNAIGSSGSTTKNVNKTSFSNLKILYPNQEVMDNYHKICEPIFGYILSLQKQNIKLRDVRDTFLPKLMSGEIRVGETAEMIE